MQPIPSDPQARHLQEHFDPWSSFLMPPNTQFTFPRPVRECPLILTMGFRKHIEEEKYAGVKDCIILSWDLQQCFWIIHMAASISVEWIYHPFFSTIWKHYHYFPTYTVCLALYFMNRTFFPSPWTLSYALCPGKPHDFNALGLGGSFLHCSPLGPENMMPEVTSHTDKVCFLFVENTSCLPLSLAHLECAWSSNYQHGMKQFSTVT